MNKKIEELGNNIKIMISDEINFTTDSILLAKFSAPSPKFHVLEIGTGCGLISLIWCRDNCAKHITAVEINKMACKMFKHSIEINNLKNKITILNADIKNLKNSLDFYHNFDMVVFNPPYNQLNTTKICKTTGRSLARQETAITLENLIELSTLFVKNNGYLCLCCRVERLSDVIYNMRKNNIEPKLLQLVQYKQNKLPKLFLIKGKKNAKPGMKCENNLIIQNETGNYTEQYKKYTVF